MSFKRNLKILILGVTPCILAACVYTVPGGVSPTVKIGLVAPFEGLYRSLGYEVLFAVKVAVRERNAAQGLNGYQVELVALNDFNDPAEAQIQAKALAADPDVLGVVGHLTSAATLAALPIYQEAGLALSVPWTTAAEPDSRREGVVNLAANESETSARLDEFSRERGFINITTLTEPNVASISSDTQAIELATEGVTAGEIILALDEAGLSLPLLGQVDVGSPQLIQVANTTANGLIFVSPAPAPRDVPKAAAFVNAYQALAGFAPGPRAVLAYDATHVLLDAIEQAMLISNRQPSRSEVNAIITDVRRQGVSGKIAFDARGWRIDAPVWLYQIGDGQYPGILISP